MAVVNAPRKLGLALSGGTLKAAAHIGVIDELVKMGVRPDVVAGTSAGALIASLYAHGYQPSMLERLSQRFSLWQLVDYGFPLLSSGLNLVLRRFGIHSAFHRTRSARGLLAGRKLEQYIRHALGRQSARLPYYVIATDLITGNPVTFSNDPEAIASGRARLCEDLPKAVAASCALPGVFSPVELDDFVLVDGAFRHYVPVQVLLDAGCTSIIAVNLYQLEANWNPETIAHVLVRAFDILLKESIDNDVGSPSVVLVEPDTKHMTWYSVNEFKRCIESGRQAVRVKADEIRTLVHV